MADKGDKHMADTMVRECILGKVASGKTEALVHRVVEYLSGQLSAKGVLVLAASPVAAETSKQRTPLSSMYFITLFFASSS